MLFYRFQVQVAMKNAKNYLNIGSRRLNDPYDICITAYALHLTNTSDGNKNWMHSIMEANANSGCRFALALICLFFPVFKNLSMKFLTILTF